MDIIKSVSIDNNIKFVSIFSNSEMSNFEKLINFILYNYDKIEYKHEIKRYYINPLYKNIRNIEEVKIININPEYNDYYTYNFEIMNLINKYNIKIFNYYVFSNKISIKFDLPKLQIKFIFRKSSEIFYLKLKIKTISEIEIDKLDIFDNMYYTEDIIRNYINIYKIKILFDIRKIKNINNMMMYLIFIYLNNLCL